MSAGSMADSEKGGMSLFLLANAFVSSVGHKLDQ